MPLRPAKLKLTDAMLGILEFLTKKPQPAPAPSVPMAPTSFKDAISCACDICKSSPEETQSFIIYRRQPTPEFKVGDLVETKASHETEFPNPPRLARVVQLTNWKNPGAYVQTFYPRRFGFIKRWKKLSNLRLVPTGPGGQYPVAGTQTSRPTPPTRKPDYKISYRLEYEAGPNWNEVWNGSTYDEARTQLKSFYERFPTLNPRIVRIKEMAVMSRATFTPSPAGTPAPYDAPVPEIKLSLKDRGISYVFGPGQKQEEGEGDPMLNAKYFVEYLSDRYRYGNQAGERWTRYSSAGTYDQALKDYYNCRALFPDKAVRMFRRDCTLLRRSNPVDIAQDRPQSCKPGC